MTTNDYHKLSFGLSKILTNAYSTSFSIGIKLFSKEFRDPIYGIYGFVRIADEIVDTFHGHNKQELLTKFKQDAYSAIDNKISTNPILNSFQKVVNEYNIDRELIEAFINSMEMDLTEKYYERNDYDSYVYGSAEVVGLMCLKVFTKNNAELYEKLKFPAKQLGAAFQKVNFLRDIKSDIVERGRIYLPGIKSTIQINDENKKLLENEIKKEFHDALIGIMQLPITVRMGVLTAFLYFYNLYKKISKLSITQLYEKRISVPTYQKLFLLVKSYFYANNLTSEKLR